jgi:hypothetical protein
MNSLLLKKLFWDVDENSLANLDEKTIIQRTLSYGTWEALHAIVSTYGKEKVNSVFLEMKDTALTKRRSNFFKLVLS